MGGPSETVVVVGGAIVGSAVAYFLGELGFAGRVIVVEQDLTYRWSSTALSAASIRTQFGCPVNVLMSLYGAEFLRSARDRFGEDADVGFVERGYLILGGSENVEARLAGVEMQRAAGADVVGLTPAEAGSAFPWLRVDDLSIATMARRNEGWFDAWSLLSLLRRAATARGVTYIEARADGLLVEGGRVKEVRLVDGRRIAADWCVNAAGAASAALVADLAISLPVSARKRTVFAIRTPFRQERFPMLFDVSGAWIRPEGEGFICGIAPPAYDDPEADGDFEPALHLLEEAVWPALAHRIPALERLRVERAWAGHYEVNTLDHNGIVGAHDEIENLIFATGFSGHGVMHAPATGRGVAELITRGGFHSIDLASLGFNRIRTGTPMLETVVY